ncbi:hypothetical protein DO97_14975 [Neosynechococcus sphagnicola sy1]|uniref:Aspartyl protease n=1 Tax=Neosynechococcus sphagnicola sy1 TaxID=1497020 RepID=A0A098TLX5_9CYAN|nr:hypothetical protein DO97_14975 [Neosynechococcus sphagnicola sy1]
MAPGLLWSTALAIATGVFPPSIVRAQDSGCFMVTPTGGTLDLNRLCGGSAASDPNQRVFRARIKRRAGGTPVIDVTFNGKQTFEMIVDTGASGTLLTYQMAVALRVKPVGYVNVETASDRNLRIPVGYVKSIEVNGAVAENVLVAVAGPDLGIGLLGHDFFGNYDVTIKRDVVEFSRR